MNKYKIADTSSFWTASYPKKPYIASYICMSMFDYFISCFFDVPPPKKEAFQKTPWRLLIFFLFAALPFVEGQDVLNKKIDFVCQNQRLSDILWALGEQSQVPFIFANNNFGKETYTYTFQQKSLHYILSQVLKTTKHRFDYVEGQVLILKKEVPKRTISGYIEDEATGERLIGANLLALPNQKGTATNVYGFFSLTIAANNTRILISYLGYQTKTLDLQQLSQKTLVIPLTPDLNLPEIIVTQTAKKTALIPINGENEVLNHPNLSKMPTLGGEVDVLRNIQQLPGTQTGTDGLGGLHVRGGNTDQNLVLLDGVPIYNPYHSLGLFSIFDHHTVQKVSYYKGQFPARFGGRLSSIVDVRTKNGNNKAFHAQAATGLISSKCSIEGPLIKEKLAFLISARRTHLDPFLKNYSRKERRSNNEKGDYNYLFGEVIGKLNYTVSTKDRFYLSFYKGKDVFQNEKEVETLFTEGQSQLFENQNLDWGNSILATRWNHLFGDKIFSNLTFTYSRFQFGSVDIAEDIYTLTNVFSDTLSYQSLYQSEIENASLKFDLDIIPNHTHYWRIGTNLSQHFFKPGVFNSDSILRDAFGNYTPNPLFNPASIKTFEWNTYVEDEWKIQPNFQINAGIYTSLFLVDKQHYFLIDPRLAFLWKASKSTQFHLSLSKMSQNIHVLTRANAGFPTDLWVPSTASVEPEQARLLDVGINWHGSKGWALSLDAYWKRMDKLLDYQEDVDFNIFGNNDVLNANQWEDNITFGKGRSKGIEILLKKDDRKTKTWLAYTLSKTSRQFEETNKGKAFPARFDHRHNLSINLLYQVNPKWSCAATWTYTSGSRTNIPLSKWQYIRQDGTPDFFYYDLGEKNSYLLPAYHRLDVMGQYEQERKWGSWSAKLGIYNAYNRVNIYYIKPVFDPLTENVQYKAISLIPFLPYFNFSIKI